MTTWNLSCNPPPTAEQVMAMEEKERKRILERSSAFKKLSAKDKVRFTVARMIAESDSIGEGYSYCPFYSIKDFEAGDEYRDLADNIIKKIISSMK
jgi:hypothetical protein